MIKTNSNKIINQLIFFVFIAGVCSSCYKVEEEYITNNGFTEVQPMTGIVLWEESGHNNTNAISLEFSYMLYSDIVSEEGIYDWSAVEQKLDAIAERKHQAIFRFRYVYPGFETAVPQYIKNLSSYDETEGISEKQTTWFPDWTNQELKDFTLEFYAHFSEKYDEDPRLAFLQVGFGLWGEYHIYDGPEIIGETFPSVSFQETFFNHMDSVFQTTHWSISIDAAKPTVGPFDDFPYLLDTKFGVFDDSFMNEDHGNSNELMWNYFANDRYTHSPCGGEFSYYSSNDQKNALSPDGANGEPYESFAERFHITYIIGNDQPSYHTMDRIKVASINSGYKFEVILVETIGGQTKITANNIGVAPIYYDAYFSLNNILSNESLKSLMPGEQAIFTIDYIGDESIEIQCDRLVEGQSIQFKQSF
ncbi:MAG: hypothetical protein ACI8ZM_001751 [Crocinitomix sp.]|jgi:hypothetical protein